MIDFNNLEIADVLKMPNNGEIYYILDKLSAQPFTVHSVYIDSNINGVDITIKLGAVLTDESVNVEITDPNEQIMIYPDLETAQKALLNTLTEFVTEERYDDTKMSYFKELLKFLNAQYPEESI